MLELYPVLVSRHKPGASVFHAFHLQGSEGEVLKVEICSLKKDLFTLQRPLIYALICILTVRCSYSICCSYPKEQQNQRQILALKFEFIDS